MSDDNAAMLAWFSDGTLNHGFRVVSGQDGLDAMHDESLRCTDGNFGVRAVPVESIVMEHNLHAELVAALSYATTTIEVMRRHGVRSPGMVKAVNDAHAVLEKIKTQPYTVAERTDPKGLIDAILRRRRIDFSAARVLVVR